MDGGENSSLPLYRRVKEDIRSNILEGRWPRGGRLPSEAGLEERYGVSRITIRKALDELAGEGYLERRRGRGTFVSSVAIEQRLSKFYSFSQALRDKGFQERAKLLLFKKLFCDAHLAGRLMLAEGEPVFRIDRLRNIERVPYAFEKSFIPVRTAPGLTADMVSGKGIYRSLNGLGVFLDGATEQLRAVNTTEETAELLKYRAGEAAMLLERIAFSDGQRVEYCRSIVRGDLLSYTVELK